MPTAVSPTRTQAEEVINNFPNLAEFAAITPVHYYPEGQSFTEVWEWSAKDGLPIQLPTKRVAQRPYPVPDIDRNGTTITVTASDYDQVVNTLLKELQPEAAP